MRLEKLRLRTKDSSGITGISSVWHEGLRLGSQCEAQCLWVSVTVLVIWNICSERKKMNTGKKGSCSWVKSRILLTSLSCFSGLTLGNIFIPLPSPYSSPPAPSAFILESLRNILVLVLMFQKETIIFPLEFPFNLPDWNLISCIKWFICSIYIQSFGQGALHKSNYVG